MLIHELKMKCKSVNMRLDGGWLWWLWKILAMGVKKDSVVDIARQTL